MSFKLEDALPQVKVTVCTALFLFVCYNLFKYGSVLLDTVRTHLAINGLPSAPGADFLNGHLSKLTHDMAMISWFRSLGRYGKTLKHKAGMLNHIMATHPDSAKLLLNTPSNKMIPTWHFMRPYLGDGLLTSSGEKWFRNRKLLTPIFHFRVLQEYVTPMQKHFENLANEWNKKGTSAVETFKDVNETTMNILLSIAFGDSVLTKDQVLTLKSAIDEILILWFKRVSNILHWSDVIYKYSENGRRFAKFVTMAHNLSRSVLQTCKRNIENNDTSEPSYASFIQRLLVAKDEDGKGLSDQDILDEVHTFLFAGQDTVGSAIPYSLYHLASHQDFQERCRQEINKIMGERDQITWEDVSKMPFLTTCIKESLRLTGPVVMISRNTDVEVAISKEAVIPKGCPVWIGLEAVHHNPSVWPEPNKFDPYRFSAADADQRLAHAFLPFSSGPRNCIGQVFAMTEIKVALIVMLRKFRFQLDENQPLEQTFPLLRGTKNGMWFFLDPI